MNYNPLAESLNADLSMNGCRILDMLSSKGKAIFFPSKGILGQGAEAKGASINATIGTALEDDGSPFTAHTTNPVPLVVVGKECALKQEGGKLCDLSPTMLDIMGLDIPAEMSGVSLIEK